MGHWLLPKSCVIGVTFIYYSGKHSLRCVIFWFWLCSTTIFTHDKGLKLNRNLPNRKNNHKVQQQTRNNQLLTFYLIMFLIYRVYLLYIYKPNIPFLIFATSFSFLNFKFTSHRFPIVILLCFQNNFSY